MNLFHKITCNRLQRIERILPILMIFTALFPTPRKAAASFEPGKWPCAFLARGSSGIAVSGLENGFVINPALLTDSSANSLSVFYRNYYGLSDLNDFNLTLQWRFFRMPMGGAFGQFGDKNYREQTLIWAMAWSITKHFSLGLALQVFWLNIKHYGQATALGSLLAVHYKISSQLSLATVAGNLNEPRLNGRADAIPVYFDTGLQWKPLQRLSFSLDIFKDDRFDFDFRYGLGYHFVPSIELLAGFRQQTHTFTAGLQIRKMMIHFGYALEWHPELGVSNAIEVTYAF